MGFECFRKKWLYACCVWVHLKKKKQCFCFDWHTTGLYHWSVPSCCNLGPIWMKSIVHNVFVLTDTSQVCAVTTTHPVRVLPSHEDDEEKSEDAEHSDDATHDTKDHVWKHKKELQQVFQSYLRNSNRIFPWTSHQANTIRCTMKPEWYTVCVSRSLLCHEGQVVHSNFFIGFCCSRPLLCLPNSDNTQLRKSNLAQATLKRCCNQRCNY